MPEEAPLWYGDGFGDLPGSFVYGDMSGYASTTGRGALVVVPDDRQVVVVPADNTITSVVIVPADNTTASVVTNV